MSHALKYRPKSEQKIATWAVARKLKVFTAYRLSVASETNYENTRTFCKEWEQEGWIDRITVGRGRRLVFRVRGAEMDRGAKTPDQAMWDTARYIRTFTAADLRVQASTEAVPISEKQARDFVTMLLSAGYLSVLRKALPGSRDASYRLIAIPGPLAPEYKRVKCVWDPNTQAYAYVPEPRS